MISEAVENQDTRMAPCFWYSTGISAPTAKTRSARVKRVDASERSTADLIARC